MLARRPLALAVLAFASLARAQTTQPAAPPPTPLADHVPAGALFYAAWTGRDHLPTEFADSHLSLLLTALDLPGWSKDTLPGLLPPHAQNQFTEPLLELVRTITGYAWSNRAALYTLGPGMSEELKPDLQLCFMIEFPTAALADAAEKDIQNQITAIMGAQPIPNVQLFRRDNTLAFTINDASSKSPLDPLTAPLSTTDAYKQGIQQTGPASITLFLNLERAWTLIDENNEGNEEYARNIKISGLHQARTLTISAGTDARDFASHAFVQIERDPTVAGIFGFLTSPKTVDDNLYAGVPKTALSVNSMSFDLADLLARLRVEGEQFIPGFTQKSDAWTGLIGGMLGVNVPEFSSNVGPDFALYTLPGPTSTTYDFVLLTHPADAPKADRQLLGLAQGIQRLLLTQRPDLAPMSNEKAEAAGNTLTTLTNGKLSPSWAVKDGYLLIAPSRRVLESALAEMAKGPLTDSPDFTHLRSRLKAPPGASLGYADLPKTLVNMYASWQFTSRLAGSKIPQPLRVGAPLPTGAQLEPETAPCASAAWVDAAGLHYKTLSPYPAAEILSPLFSLLAGPNSLPLKMPQLKAALAKPAAP